MLRWQLYCWPKTQVNVPVLLLAVQSSSTELPLETERVSAVKSLTFAGIPTTVNVSPPVTSKLMLPVVLKHAGRVRYRTVVPSGHVGGFVGLSVGIGVGLRDGESVGLVVGRLVGLVVGLLVGRDVVGLSVGCGTQT